ncbi:MAG: hypothetical protein ABIC04_00655 [Nanoarchaeota archaeon]
MNKKAMESYSTTMWIPKLMILIGGAVFILYLITSSIIHDVGIENIRSEIFIERAVFSCLSYHDSETDRRYVHIIDIGQFNAAALSNCINYGDKKTTSAKLTLKEFSGKENVIYYNKNEYDRWQVFNLKGGDFTKVNREKYVLIKDNDKITNGIIKFEIITFIG